ncbi:MAG: hypothetical protein FJ387_14805 [Verrucomicrobia bacterium]|nr:hypothetical protein [Verrucomicrobiota bacterium]
MISFLRSKWMVALLGGLSYLLTTVLTWHPPSLPARTPQAGPAEAEPVYSPAWSYRNPEVDSLIAELRSERTQLETRRLELQQWEARLRAERSEINTLTQIVHQLQLDLDSTFMQVQESEKTNLKRLAKVYTEMSPESVATIFEQIEDEAVLKILTTLREPEVAAILNAMAKEPAQTKRVALLCERLRALNVRDPAATRAAPK